VILEYTFITDTVHKYAPTCGTSDSAGIDIPLQEQVVFKAGCSYKVPLNIALNIPVGWCAHMVGRSSTFAKYGLIVPSSIIDADYKREIHGFISNPTAEDLEFPAGARLWQIHMLPVIHSDLACVEHIEDTGRGGLGSTGL
jgi:dUTP pyrophosphatase